MLYLDEAAAASAFYLERMDGPGVRRRDRPTDRPKLESTRLRPSDDDGYGHGCVVGVGEVVRWRDCVRRDILRPRTYQLRSRRRRWWRFGFRRRRRRRRRRRKRVRFIFCQSHSRVFRQRGSRGEKIIVGNGNRRCRGVS